MHGGAIDLGNPIAEHPLNDGLVAWYLGLPNNSNGAKLFDLRNRYHGTLTNSPLWTGTKHDDLHLTRLSYSSTAYVNIATPLVTTVPLTITGWFWTSSTSGVQPIATIQQASTNNNMFRMILYQGFVQAQSQDSGSGNLAATGSYATSQWGFGAVVFDASGQKAYYNATSPGTSGIRSPGSFDISYIGRTSNVDEYMNGLIDDVRFYNRALSDAQIKEIYYETLTGRKNTLRRIPTRRWSFGDMVGGGAATYTAAIAATVGAATAALSAEFDPPVYTGAIAATVAPAIAALSAQHTPPTYTGEIAATTAPAVAALDATFDEGTFTGAIAATAAPATAALSATFTAPFYTATIGASAAPATAALDATFAPGTKTANIAASTGPVTAAVAASFSPGTKTAAIAAGVGAATAELDATFAPGTKTATIAATVGATTAALDASFTAPVYTADIAATVGATTAALTGIFATAVFSAEIAATTAPATAALDATFDAGTATGAIAASVGPATAAMSAEFDAPVYTASIAATIAAATAALAAEFDAPVYTAAIGATTGATTAALSATFAAPVYTATIGATVGAATADLSATFDAPVYTASIGAVVGATTAALTAIFATDLFSATIAAVVAPATAELAATFVPGAVVTPVADFSGSPNSGVLPLLVTFEDLSTDGPTSWLWDFGDGATSTVQNPQHIYTSAGTYSVVLTVTNIAGSDQRTRLNYIVVGSPVVEQSGGGGGGPLIIHQPQVVEIDFGNEPELAAAEVDRLQLELEQLVLRQKIRRQRDEEELVFLGVI